jgi:RimJ/RimL family protein N-acetyltransferase
LEKLLLKPRTLEHVKIFWEKSQDEEIERLFPFNRGTLSDAIKLYEKSLKPSGRSFGEVIYMDDKYIGDVWCYGIDEAGEKQAFVSIVIFDKTYWDKGIGKD